LYAAPIASSFLVAPPARVHALDPLTLPALQFPVLRTHALPASRTAAASVPTQFFSTRHHAAPRTGTHLLRTGAIVLRHNWIAPATVVTNRYGPALSSPKPSTPPTAAPSGTPVTSSVAVAATLNGAQTQAEQAAAARAYNARLRQIDLVARKINLERARLVKLIG
jgi:hypothetical protein